MKSEKLLIIFGYTLISIIWGSTWLAIKVGLDSVPPFYGIAIRFTLASLILYFIVVVRRIEFPVDRNSLLLYFYLAILSFSFPFAFVYWGQQYIASGLASILFAAFPFVVAIGSHFYLPTERLNIFKSTGIILGFIGVILLFWSDIQIGESSTLGMIAVLCSTLMQGASLIIIKRMNQYISPISLSLGGMLLGIIIMYTLALSFEDYKGIRFDEKGIGSILYLGTIGTVVTYVIYFWLLKRIEAVYLSLISFITPIIAIILGAILLKESLSPHIFTGAIFVLFGILVTHGKDIIMTTRNKESREY